MREVALFRIKAIQSVVSGKPDEPVLGHVSASDYGFLQRSVCFCSCCPVFQEEYTVAVMRPYTFVGLADGQHMIAGNGFTHVDRKKFTCLRVQSSDCLAKHQDISVRFPAQVDVSSCKPDLV